jgi:2-C-methyl-D-erythritol 2,4-cyclodiphosphate synthase
MIRTGIGYDIHQFAEERRLMLGGVAIPSERGLAGHSDADVALHALADALLGAAALGDIGHFFPPGDPTIAGIDSRVILRAAAAQVRESGYEISNVDLTVIAERPQIAPFIPAMRTAIAESLEIELTSVGIKATTNERLGALGRGEGIAALAIATIFDRTLMERT